MRYSIDEKTRKPAGVPKGVNVDRKGYVIEGKAEDKCLSQAEILDEENKKKLALASLDVETRAKAIKPAPKHEPVKEKKK